MERTTTSILVLILAIVLFFGFSGSGDNGKIYLTINKNQDGKSVVFEKTYDNKSDMQADIELRSFDQLMIGWLDEYDQIQTLPADHAGKGERHVVIHRFSDKQVPGASENQIEIRIQRDLEEHAHAEELETGSDGEQQKKEIVKIITPDGTQIYSKQFSRDGDEDQEAVWKDKEGNITEFTDKDIEKAVVESREKEIAKEKKVEVRTSVGNAENIDVFVNLKDGEGGAIDRTKEEETVTDGREKTIQKHVRISKEGKSIKLDHVDSYEFIKNGDNITIEVNGERRNPDEMHNSELEEDMIEMMHDEEIEGEDTETMQVEIREEHGAQFIDIQIERHTGDRVNVTISDIEKQDPALQDFSYSLKNNLKTEQLRYYPNPSGGVFHLKFELVRSGKTTVKVLDILGNEIYKETILDFSGTYDNQIDLSGKDKGMYILQVNQGRKTLSRKILIE